MQWTIIRLQKLCHHKPVCSLRANLQTHQRLHNLGGKVLGHHNSNVECMFWIGPLSLGQSRFKFEWRHVCRFVVALLNIIWWAYLWTWKHDWMWSGTNVTGYWIRVNRPQYSCKSSGFACIFKHHSFRLNKMWSVNKKSEEFVNLHSDSLEMPYELNIKMKFVAGWCQELFDTPSYNSCMPLVSLLIWNSALFLIWNDWIVYQSQMMGLYHFTHFMQGRH